MHIEPKSMKQFLWHYVKPQKNLIFCLIFTAVFHALLVNLIGPYFLKRIVDVIAQSGPEITTEILTPAIAYVALFACSATNFRCRDWANIHLYPAMHQRIILAMFRHLKRHSSRMFQDNFAGNLSNKIFDIANGTITIFERLDDTVNCVAGLLIALVAMGWVHPVFIPIVLIWWLLYWLISTHFLGQIRQLSQNYSENSSDLVGRVVDSLGNIGNIRLFAGYAHEQSHLKKIVNDNVNKDRDVRWKIFKMRAGHDVTMVLFIAFILVALVCLFREGLVTPGDFALVISVAITSLQLVWYLSDQFVGFTEAWGKCKQGLTVITAPHDVVDAPNAESISITKGRIVFEHVTFHYPAQHRLFNDKNIIIEAGQKVGLVGTSGSGKTTFANLILRHFDVDHGRILIDDQDIALVTQDSLRKNIAFIAQDTSLFHRSIMENIRYGRLEATDDEVIAAAHLAHCDEFIHAMPDNYHTMVGERGVKLSGGQRQRISIARAILKNAPILILDEATSALDTHTEYYIQQALTRLMDTRSTLVIAHRLSTLAKMNRILVFQNGHIIEDGTPDALISMNGKFAAMCKMHIDGILADAPHS